MKNKVLNTIFISLALIAIYLTVFYSKNFKYDFELHSDLYEYFFHAIILILPFLIVVILLLNSYLKKQNVSVKLERNNIQKENQINANLQSQILNYEKELERIHEKYVNLSTEADAIMIQFNDVVQKLINSKIENLEKTDERKEKLVQQMFYDLANPIRIKLTNLKTITASAIESLKRTEHKNESIQVEYENLMDDSNSKLKKHELVFSQKDSLISSLKENESEIIKKNNSLREKLRNLEITNQILDERFKNINRTDNELLIEIEKLEKENSELLKSLDQVKPYRKKYSK